MNKKADQKKRTRQKSAAGRNRSKITKKNIKKRAYEIFLSREPHEGSPEDDWFRAEDELYSDPGY